MSTSRQSGAVSLFVVIFAMLLISVVTISFLRLMISDQTRATNSDLSQSAYDSAQAGVEDAKRALLYMQTLCRDGGADCDTIMQRFAATTDECNAILRDTGIISAAAEGTGNNGKTGEIRVQTTAGNDELLQQAYTCVTIALKTDDFVGTASADRSELIPLVGEAAFNTVTVQWFSTDDISTGSTAVNVPASAGSQPLSGDWPANRPPVMRTQFIQFGPNSTLSDFDATSGGSSNSNTIFGYPSTSGSTSTPATPIDVTSRDVRADSPTADPIADTANDSPLPIRCSATLNAGGFSCSASYLLPSQIGGGARSAYLRLTPLYNGAHYRVTLTNGTSPIKFENVQPVVDSTGRANDLFRRVQSRVDLYDTTFPFPEAAVDISGNFCKDFSVTDTQYIAGTCTP